MSGSHPAGPEAWRPRPIRAPAPDGYHVVPTTVLAGIGELPCDVFVREGDHVPLYATVGADASDLLRRTERGMAFLVRDEDEEPLRHTLAAALPTILADVTVPPLERSRRAYSIAARLVEGLFVHGSSVDAQGLGVTHAAIDAVTESLVEEEDLVWSMVATMQKHLATHTHAVNTAVYSVILSRFLRVADRDELRDVGRGALLHDIGKNRVPAAILDKPGPLDADEWTIMRAHPRVGYEAVVGALGSDPGYAHIIAEHHERLDGSGYPGGRHGNQVAIDSQLVAIADAFDALTSARSYKPAASPYEALRTLRFSMRGQFNDDLLRAFVGLLGGWGELRRDEFGIDQAIREA